MTTADLRRALELWAKVPHPYNEIQFERSLALALLAGLGGDAKSSMTAAETRTFAARPPPSRTSRRPAGPFPAN